MKKSKFFLLPICVLLLGACQANTPAKESESKPAEASSPAQETSSVHEHSFPTEWTHEKEPTCTEDGLDVKVCSCGERQTYVVEKLGHDWDVGTVTTEPTLEKEGVRTFKCKRQNCTATKTEPIAKLEGYDITFAATNCKIYIFESKDYTVEPEELPASNKVKSRDENGLITKYVAADAEKGIAEVKPQVNFKVVCEDGYKVSGEDNIAVSGTKGTDWNNIKYQGNGIYRVTVIRTDITITVTPEVDDGGDEIEAAKATFDLTNCSVKVYIGKKNDAGDNIDAGPVFYSRHKDNPTEYAIGDNAQFNFEIIPEEGYEWVDTTEYSDKGEAAPEDVTFITGSYNKAKLLAKNLYNLTKVRGDLVITINCTPVSE